MSRKKILLVGAGGHAKSCIDVIEQEGKFEIAGLIIPDLDTEKNVLNYPFVGTDNDLENLKSDYDYALRMFGTKNLGVIEDPVTGSAQPPIFSYWSHLLKKEEVLVHQSSERGGLMRVRRDLRGIDVNGRVKLVKNFNQEI